MLKHPIDRLQLIFKCVERCNINCTYCYYFNQEDQSAFERPKVVKLDKVRAIAKWASCGARELDIPQVNVVFHGGEPMMMAPSHFGDICAILVEHISPVAKLSFSIQTNGTLISEKWLKLFKLFNVHVGVSIDGTKKANDRYRLDLKGRSTYDIVSRNLSSLASSFNIDGAGGCSTISVLDIKNDYSEIYRKLREMGVVQMSFLLPDRNQDSPISLQDANAYGDALFDVFFEWLREDNPSVAVRQISEFLIRACDAPATKPKPASQDFCSSRPFGKNQIVVARTDGTITVDDSLMPAFEWYSQSPIISVSETTLSEFLCDSSVVEISDIETKLPKECQTCEFSKLCGGGDLEHRFSKLRQFDNPSVYCASYKRFFSKALRCLVSNGYPPERLAQAKLMP